MYGLIQHASQRLQTTIRKSYLVNENGSKKYNILTAKLGRVVRLAIVKDVAVVVKGQGFDFKINPSLRTNAKWSEVDENIKEYVRCKAEPKGVVPEHTMKKLMIAINRSLQTPLQNTNRYAIRTTSTDRTALEITFCLWMLQLECDDRLDPKSKLHPYNGRRFQDNDLKMDFNGAMRQVDNFLHLAPVTNPGKDGFLSLGLFVSLASTSQANSTDTSPLIQALVRVMKNKDKTQMKESQLKRKASKSGDTSGTAKKKRSKKQAVGDSKADKQADADKNKENAKMSGYGSDEKGDQIAKFFKEMNIKFDDDGQEQEMIRSLLVRIADVESDEPGETDDIGTGVSIADVTNDNESGETLNEESEVGGDCDDIDGEEDEDEDEDEEGSSGEEMDEGNESDYSEEEERSFINELLGRGEYPQMRDKNGSVRMSLCETIKKGHLRSTRSKKRSISIEDDTFITNTFESDTDVDQRETNLKKYAEQFNIVVKIWFEDNKGELQSKIIGATESNTTASARPMHIYVNQYQPKNASEPIVLKGYALLTDRIKKTHR